MGFTFEKKPTVEICGKEYECDFTDKDMIEGIALDFPKIIAAANEFTKLQEELTHHPKEGMEKLIVKANENLLFNCRKFIEGALGVKEYNEILAKRRANSTEHLNLCTFLFQYIMDERQKLLKQYLDLPKGNKNVVDIAAK